MASFSRRSMPVGSSRKLPSSRFRSSAPTSQRVRKPAGETPLQKPPAGAVKSVAASGEVREMRCEGQRLGHVRGGRLRIVCGCGHSGDVPVAALVARHGDEARVRDAVASMRCGFCGARRIQEIRLLS